MSSSSKELRAEPIPITLRDGETVGLRFDFLGIAMLEDAFGSVTGMQKALEGLSAKGKLFRPMIAFLAAGLASTHPNLTEEVLLQRADHRRIQEYIDAVSSALTLAFGEPEGKAAAPEAETTSPGANGTSTQPSRSAEAKVSSGV